MLNIVNTVIALFIVIFIGWIMRWKGFLPYDLVSPLNRLVFYFGIPAMIFREVARTSFEMSFNIFLLLGTLVPCALVFLLASLLVKIIPMSQKDRGSFIQISIHGNLGYMGLAVAFYVLGQDGFATASILAGFLILLQNFLAIVALQIHSASGLNSAHRVIFILKKIAINPIIFASFAGVLFSAMHLSMPMFVDRSLKILGSMALPLALILIGASLSLTPSRYYLKLTAIAATMKLFILPGLGLVLYFLTPLNKAEFLPGLVLLAAPTATVTYIMAAEMGGSQELASTAVSIATLFSLLSYVGWLGVV